MKSFISRAAAAASAAFRRWIFASSPPSATQRALFFHALMTYQFSRLTGPIERAEMLVNNTHEYYIFRWPAACFLVLIGGAQNLKLVQHVSHFLWFVCACASTVLAGSDWLGKPERTGFVVRAVHIVERLSTALLACCFILLHGVQSTLVDYQHQYYSVLYSLIALAQPIDSITDKLILTCLAQTYFSGGLAKLLGAGPRWFDGSHLCYLIKERAHWFYLLLRPETFPRLNSALYLIASWGAVLWELSMAPMLVWIDRLGVRCVFIGSAIGFHVAARLLLGASFNAQVGTFLLVLPKPPPRPRTPMHGGEYSPMAIHSGEYGAVHAAPSDRESDREEDLMQDLVQERRTERECADEQRRGGMRVMGSVLLVLLGVSVCRVECWPFTFVPMYSGNYETVSRWVRFRLRVAHVLIDTSVKTTKKGLAHPVVAAVVASHRRMGVPQASSCLYTKAHRPVKAHAQLSHCLGVPDEPYFNRVLRPLGFAFLVRAHQRCYSSEATCSFAERAVTKEWHPGAGLPWESWRSVLPAGALRGQHPSDEPDMLMQRFADFLARRMRLDAFCLGPLQLIVSFASSGHATQHVLAAQRADPRAVPCGSGIAPNVSLAWEEGWSHRASAATVARVPSPATGPDMRPRGAMSRPWSRMMAKNASEAVHAFVERVHLAPSPWLSSAGAHVATDTKTFALLLMAAFTLVSLGVSVAYLKWRSRWTLDE